VKVNVHTSHPSAFISSTFQDLSEERKAVAYILHNRGLNVNALDVIPASNNTSKKEIVNGIRQSDFIILIIGDRYGSINPKLTGNSTISITWWEYKRAISFGKPVLSYFKNGIGTDPQYHDDHEDPRYKMKRKKFEQFKKLIVDKHNPAYFKDLNDLSIKVDKALIPVYRAGVEALTKQNVALSQRVAELEQQINTYKNHTGIGTSNNASNSSLSDLLVRPNNDSLSDFLKRLK
jgi:hypothetical protein